MACFSFKTHKKRLQKFGRKQNKSRTWSQTQNLKIIANGFLIENGEKPSYVTENGHKNGHE